ncbi:MAG TPA: hypothetical protein VFJ46_04490 [Xanthobacteraceae bacterium]|nr:hypothetical protein [Xanthobacteraceae bacterium]
MRKMMVAAVIVALGWPPFTAKGEPGAPAGAKEPYAPGIAEIMIMTQIRHAKLWLAGNAGNWELADYQIEELKEGFEDVVSHFPVYKDMPVGQMIEATIMPPIDDVEKAIKSHDRAKFVSTFDRLTEACNRCHQAANRAFIVIRRPSGAIFTNQSFPPKRK